MCPCLYLPESWRTEISYLANPWSERDGKGPITTLETMLDVLGEVDLENTRCCYLKLGNDCWTSSKRYPCQTEWQGTRVTSGVNVSWK